MLNLFYSRLTHFCLVYMEISWFQTQAYLILLHFAEIVYFYKYKVCGNPATSIPIDTIFPTAFAHFISLCNILVFHYFKLFILTIFVIIKQNIMVICDQWSFFFFWSVTFDVTVVIIWGSTMNCTHIRQWTQQINVLTALPTGCSPSFSLSLDLPIPWDTTILKIGQLIILQFALSVQMKARVTYVILNQKL